MNTCTDPISKEFTLLRDTKKSTNAFKDAAVMDERNVKGELKVLIKAMMSLKPSERPVASDILKLPLCRDTPKPTPEEKVIFQKTGLTPERYEKIYEEIASDLS